MATIPVTSVTIAGVTDVKQAVAAGGDVVPNNGDMWVEIINGDASPTTVTAATPATIQGVAIADPTLTVAAGARRKWGPFDPGIFNNSSGQVAFTYSNSTSIEIGAYTI